MYNRILTALQLPKGAKCSEGAHFTFWCMKHFKYVKIGWNDVLHCNKSPILLSQSKKCWRPSNSAMNVWDMLDDQNLAWNTIKLCLGSTWCSSAVSANLQSLQCLSYCQKPSSWTSYAFFVIFCDDFRWTWLTCQAVWIVTLSGYCKFIRAYPLASKYAKDVADRITELFCQFGPSNILQLENVKELVTAVINEKMAWIFHHPWLTKTPTVPGICGTRKWRSSTEIRNVDGGKWWFMEWGSKHVVFSMRESLANHLIPIKPRWRSWPIKAS